MPGIALALVAFWFLTLFVGRSVLQWRRTGSTGWKGVSGRVGSIEWMSGVLTACGFAATLASPLATLQGWPGSGLLWNSAPAQWTGVSFGLLGTLGALFAQTTMGDSWRIGVDEDERNTFVTAGLFRWVRNPIFSCVLLSLVGLVLTLPTTLSVVAAMLSATGIELQVRFVEEPYLRDQHGDAYDDYCAQTGRFVPGIGRSA